MRRIPFPSILALALLVALLSACGGASGAGAGPSPGASSAGAAAEASAPATPTAPAPTATLVPTAQAEELSPEQLAEQLRPATVRVIAEFGATAVAPEGLGAGTGIVYDLENGYIITNAHVVEGASVVKVALADSTRTRPARVLGRAQCDDLAVLKVDNTDGMAAAPLGDSVAAKVGAQIVALGYPFSFDLGNDLSVNVGNISQLNAQLGIYQDLIKIDAAINHGNSGGPLANSRGEVIGVNTLGFDGTQNQNYAIAMSYARPIVEQLAEGQNRNHLGLNIVPNDYADYFGTGEGMVVVGVASGGPAARSGMAPADLLLEVEGKSISSQEALCDVLRSHTDGDHLTVSVLRGDTGDILQGEMVIGQSGAGGDKGSPLTVVGSIGGQDDAAGGQDDAADQADDEDYPVNDPNAVCGQATVVDVDALAIRAEPSRSSEQLGEVPRGGVVDLLCQEPIDGDGRTWVRVRYGEVEGYMSTNYLQ